MSEYPEPTIADAMETIYRQAVQISHLQKDNARLSAQVSAPEFNDQTGQQQGRDSTPSSVRASIAQVQADSNDTRTSAELQLERLSQEHKQLQLDHACLKSEHAGCAVKIQAYQQKYREAKARVKEWKDYLNQSGKHARTHSGLKLEQTLLSTPQNPTGSPERSRDNVAREDETPRAPHTAHAAVTANLVTTRPSSPPETPIRSEVAPVTSSQTTVDDGESLRVHEWRPQSDRGSDDLPVFVSTRPVKRKAGTARSAEEPPLRRIKQEPRSPRGVVELSSDGYLEAPQDVGKQLIRSEPSDLDTIGPLLTTPRQRRRDSRVGHLARHASCEPARPTPKLPQAVSSLSEGDIDLSSLAAKMTQPGGIPCLAADDRKLSPGEPRCEPVANDSTTHDVLQPLSINVLTTARTAKKSCETKAAFSRHDTTLSKIKLLSEGDDVENSRNKKPKPSDESDHRLYDLLNRQSQERSPILPGKAMKSAATARHSRTSPQQYPTPASRVKQTSPVKRRSPLKQPNLCQPQEPAPTVLPEHEPLRLRDLKTLTIEDFKVNPNYIGTKFAVADTLRGRDARRNLQSCTRADCCGGVMQRAISIGGSTLTGKTDAQALEDFLGPNWDEHIGAYGSDKRQEIVLQAHVHCFAKQHGKHRHAFARRNTPPGFWETDFPTTQETERNAEKAREMQRQVVQERWREAIRGDGRWRFRDE